MVKYELVDKKLLNYIQTKILPIYETFDRSHNLSHINNVICRSFDIANTLHIKTNPNIVYTAACFHDIGISISRKYHAKNSGSILKNDKFLNSFFSSEEMRILIEAVEDHSTSLRREPRNIYGKIVSDADKDMDINLILKRVLNFAKHYYPNYTESQILDDCHNYIVDRFGPNGLVKFWILDSDNNLFLEEMRKLALNKDLSIEILKKVC